MESGGKKDVQLKFFFNPFETAILLSPVRDFFLPSLVQHKHA
jgi:hypothetical protein